MPGTYRVRLTYNGQVREEAFQVISDPRLPNTDEDYRQQFDFLIAVRDEVSTANRSIERIRNLKKDMEYLEEKFSAHPEVLQRVAAFEEELTTIENNIHMTKNQSRQDPLNYGIRINNRLAFLMADSQRGDYPPTDQAREFFAQAKAELDSELKDLERLVGTEVDAINDMVSNAGVPLLNWED